jgi:hypothetical protein
MPAVRRLVDSTPFMGMLSLPPSFANRAIEVIVLPAFEDEEAEPVRVSATEMDKMLAASKVRRISGLLKDLPQDISMRDIRKMRLEEAA